MGGDGDSTVGGAVVGYGRLRRELDDAGYRDVLPLEGLPLVQHIFYDLTKTTQSLQKAIKQYSYYKKIALELETGVGPFKEENVRLIRENSHLRMAAVRASEDYEDRVRGIRKRVGELEEEKVDLKQLVKQLSQRLEILTFEKSGRSKLEEKDQVHDFDDSGKSVLKDKENLEQDMDYECRLPFDLPDPCPFCVRVKNQNNYDGDKKAADYFKITDSRIEALQLQIRALKDAEKDKNQLLSSMKSKVESRDREIEKLRQYVTIRPGKDNVANGMSSELLSNNESKDSELRLKSAQMQLDMLQKRNINLEKKLKSSILQEHDDFMMGRTRTPAERELLRSLAALDVDTYPTHPEATLNEKLQNLEQQLSNCCKEKAALKAALEKCEARHRHHHQGGTLVVSEKSKSSKVPSADDLPSSPSATHDEEGQESVSDGEDGHGGNRRESAEENKRRDQRPSQIVFQSDGGLFRYPPAGHGGRSGPARSILKSKTMSVVSSKKPSVVPVPSSKKSNHKSHVSSSRFSAKSSNVVPPVPPPKKSSNIRPPGATSLPDKSVASDQKLNVGAGAGPGIRQTMPRITGSSTNPGLDSIKSSQTSQHKSTASSERQSKSDVAVSKQNLQQDLRSKSSLRPSEPIVLADDSDIEEVDQTETDSESDEFLDKKSMLVNAFSTPKTHSPSGRPGAAIARSKGTSKSEIGMGRSSSKEAIGLSTESLTQQSKNKLRSSDEKRSMQRISSSGVTERDSAAAMQPSSQRSSAESINSDSRATSPSPSTDGEDRVHDSDLDRQAFDDHRDVHYVEVRTTPLETNGNGKEKLDFLSSKSKQASRHGASLKGIEKKPSSERRIENVQSQDRGRLKKSQSIHVQEGEDEETETKSPQKYQERAEPKKSHQRGKHRDDDQRESPAAVVSDLKKSDHRKGRTITPGSQQQQQQVSKPSQIRMESVDEDDKSLNGIESEDDDEIIALKRPGPDRQSTSTRKSDQIKSDSTKSLKTTPTLTGKTKSGAATKSSRSQERSRDEKSRERERMSTEQERGPTSSHDRTATSSDKQSANGHDKRSPKETPMRSRDPTPGRQEGRSGLISELSSDKTPVSKSQHPLEAQVSNLQRELETKNVKLASMNQACDQHIKELAHLKAALQSAEQQFVRSSSKESGFEQELEIQRLKRQITNLQKDLEHLAKERDDAVEECRRLSREISIEKSKSENYKWSSQNLQPPFSTQSSSRPQISQRDELEMSRRLREQAMREQELEREVSRLKSNINALERNKTELRMELDHKDERLSRLSVELSKTQKSGRPSEYQSIGPGVMPTTSIAAREQEREVQYLKRQNESLRQEVEASRKERDEAVRDARRLALATDPTSGVGGGVGGGMMSTDVIYKRASMMEQHTSVTSQLPQRDQFEMARRLRQQAAREHELDDEISRLRSSVGKLDRDKDEMRAELDRKDEKMARMNSDFEKQLADMSKLQLALKNTEYQLGHTGDTAREHEREVQLLKRQIESLRRDLEVSNSERDEAVKDCRRLAGAVSKEEIERRSLNVEYDKKSKEADELRKQVQKYIEEVRRIEDLLLQKEEEMETLIEHYRTLSLEKNNLETQRGTLEREATSIRSDVLETVDLNITMKNQLVSQNALIVSYEQEIERLTLALSTAENQLANVTDKDRSSESDIKAARDLIYTMETKMDKLKLDLANAESAKAKLEAENQELRKHIELLEEQLQIQIEKEKTLQEFIASLREKEFEVERSSQDLSTEKDKLADRLKSMQTRTEALNDEVAKYRLRSTELQNELDKTRRQLLSEKSQRETAIAELRRVQEQLNNSSTNSLLNAALAGGTSSSSAEAGALGSRFGGAGTSSGTGATVLLPHPPTGSGGGGGLNTSGSSGGDLPFSPMSEAYLDSPLGASTARSGRDIDEDKL